MSLEYYDPITPEHPAPWRDAALAHDDIARRAYEIFEARGGDNGSDLDDWLRAERELLRERQTVDDRDPT